jgi:hypothetical protein
MALLTLSDALYGPSAMAVNDSSAQTTVAEPFLHYCGTPFKEQKAVPKLYITRTDTPL